MNGCVGLVMKLITLYSLLSFLETYPCPPIFDMSAQDLSPKRWGNAEPGMNFEAYLIQGLCFAKRRSQVQWNPADCCRALHQPLERWRNAVGPPGMGGSEVKLKPWYETYMKGWVVYYSFLLADTLFHGWLWSRNITEKYFITYIYSRSPGWTYHGSGEVKVAPSSTASSRWRWCGCAHDVPVDLESMGESKHFPGRFHG